MKIVTMSTKEKMLRETILKINIKHELNSQSYKSRYWYTCSFLMASSSPDTSLIRALFKPSLIFIVILFQTHHPHF